MSETDSTQDEQTTPTEAPDEPKFQDAPDEEAGPLVQPATGDQGEWVGEQDAPLVQPGGFDPDRPVRQSPPPAEAQSGVPQIPGGENDDVEPQPEFAGPVEGGGQSEGGAHAEANEVDGDPEEQDS